MVEKVRKLFLLDKPFVHSDEQFDSLIAGLHPDLQPVLLNFRHNLRATRNTASVPSLIAKIASGNLHIQRLTIKGRIEEINVEEIIRSVDREDDKSARHKTASLSEPVSATVSKGVLEFIQSKDGQIEIAHDTLSMLLTLARDPEFLTISQELLHQAMVGTWSAIEVLVKDGLEALINLKPHLCQILLEDLNAKKRFELPKVSLDLLLDAKFDLSNSMGTLLLDKRDLSDVQSIKSACFALFPDNAEIKSALNSREIWYLNQARHLIVHNRGVVDAQYAKNVNDGAEIGSRLEIFPDRVGKIMDEVEKFAQVLSLEFCRIQK